MKIANPIYDVVFKYLMEDAKVAKLILSALTQLEIVELEFHPQEFIANVDTESLDDENWLSRFKVYRLDFIAKVLSKDGEERLVIIEIQKSKVFTTPLRFRIYLGNQLINKNHFLEVENNGKRFKAGLPIISIYFLGETINDSFDGVPVIRIKKEIINGYTGDRLFVEDHFINSLYHEGIIVNIPALKKNRRDEIEILLSIFDQENKDSNQHIMNVNEVDFPEKYRPVVKRLQSAVQAPDIESYMRMEDVFQAEMDAFYDALKEANLQLEKADLQRQEADLKRQESDRQKQEAVRKQEAAVVLLVNSGIDKALISETLQISIDSINQIVERHAE